MKQIIIAIIAFVVTQLFIFLILIWDKDQIPMPPTACMQYKLDAKVCEVQLKKCVEANQWESVETRVIENWVIGR